jgi:hypothetical protein
MSETETTDDVDVRHRLTNDGLAYVLVVSNVALLVGALWLGVEVPQLLWQTFAASVAAASAWAFGKGALKTVLGIRDQNAGGGES